VEPILTFTRRVLREDGAICEVNQKGLRARAHAEGVLMPEEYILKRFHDWVRDQLSGKVAGPFARASSYD
jgi:Rieske 2Fe-2S family protein